MSERVRITDCEYRGYRGFDVHAKPLMATREWSWRVCESDAEEHIKMGIAANRHMAILMAKEFIDQKLEKQNEKS